MNSKHLIILGDIAQRVRDLELEGIGDRVVVMTLADDEKPELSKLPAIALSPYGSETLERATNATDDIGFPSLLVILDKADQVQTLPELDRRLFWREQCFDHFQANRFSAPNGLAYHTTIEPQPIIDAGAWFGRNVYAGGFTIRAHYRNVRRSGNV